MINRNVSIAFSEAANYTDVDAYISDIALSSMWGEDADLSDTTRIATALWDIHTGGIRSIINHSCMSARAFAVNYGIPVRTMENWSSGVNTPPDYLLLLLAHDQGLV